MAKLNNNCALRACDNCGLHHRLSWRYRGSFLCYHCYQTAAAKYAKEKREELEKEIQNSNIEKKGGKN